MKILNIMILASMLLFVTACGDDDERTDFDYKTTIVSPNADDKRVGETITVNVDFSSETGETVHHVAVSIVNKVDSTIIMHDFKDHAHMDGEFNYTTDILLDDTNNVDAHTDWILTARVWGEEAGVGEVSESLEFHVHPM